MKTRVMAVLNVTPDSFSDGGKHLDEDAAVDAGLRMRDAGAAWIDVGGESSRPGARSVPAETEMRRVVPVIERLARRVGIPISIDTSKPEVAHAALAAGATMVNDIKGFRDPEMRALVVKRGAAALVMHMQGEPVSMQVSPAYGDPVVEVSAFLAAQAGLLASVGVSRDRIYLDPGIGFGKTLAHNLAILRRIGEFAALGFPLAVGTSRKAFLGAVTGSAVDERLAATLGSVAWLALAGVELVRVHDVRQAIDVIRVIEAITGSRVGEAMAT